MSYEDRPAEVSQSGGIPPTLEIVLCRLSEPDPGSSTMASRRIPAASTPPDGWPELFGPLLPH